VSDLPSLIASTSGKIELETVGEASDEKVLGKLLQRAVLNVFNRRFSGPELESALKVFEGTLAIQVADDMPSSEYVRQVSEVPPLRTLAQKLGATEPATLAAAVEFLLEGLHLSKKLNKDTQAGAARYRR
jgi:magnesium chelatase subunit I